MSRPAGRPTGDRGFTLVELVLTVLITGVITVPLAGAAIGYFRNADSTTGRLLESHDVQMSSAYWSHDVASIGRRSGTAPYPLLQSVWVGASSLYSCPVAGDPVVSLAWDDFSSAGAASLVQVVYSVSGGVELHRVRCQLTAGVLVVGRDVTLAHRLDPATRPAVSCSTSCTAAPGVPSSIDLRLTLEDPQSRDAGYVVTLVGHRRQS